MSGIGRRLKRAVRDIAVGDYENAVTAIFQAFDATGKKRYPSKGSGHRFKKLLEDQEEIVWEIAFSVRVIGTKFECLTMPEAMWKLVRNPIVHEGEFSKRISFEGGYERLPVGENWNLPPRFLTGLATAAISAKENSDEQEDLAFKFNFFGRDIPAQSLWGAEEWIRAELENIHRRKAEKVALRRADEQSHKR